MYTRLHCSEAEKSAKFHVAFFASFEICFQNVTYFYATVVQNSPILMKTFRDFNNFYGEYQSLLDSSQIS